MAFEIPGPHKHSARDRRGGEKAQGPFRRDLMRLAALAVATGAFAILWLWMSMERKDKKDDNKGVRTITREEPRESRHPLFADLEFGRLRPSAPPSGLADGGTGRGGEGIATSLPSPSLSPAVGMPDGESPEGTRDPYAEPSPRSRPTPIRGGGAGAFEAGTGSQRIRFIKKSDDFEPLDEMDPEVLAMFGDPKDDPKATNNIRGDASAIYHVYRYLRSHTSEEILRRYRTTRYTMSVVAGLDFTEDARKIFALLGEKSRPLQELAREAGMDVARAARAVDMLAKRRAARKGRLRAQYVLGKEPVRNPPEEVQRIFRALSYRKNEPKTPADLARELGMDEKEIRHFLSKMLQAPPGLARMEEIVHYRRGEEHPGAQEREEIRKVYDLLSAEPKSLRELSGEAGLSGPMTRRLLQRMKRSGLCQREVEQRFYRGWHPETLRLLLYSHLTDRPKGASDLAEELQEEEGYVPAPGTIGDMLRNMSSSGQAKKAVDLTPVKRGDVPDVEPGEDELAVFRAIQGLPKTARELAAKTGLSRERVRAAIKKLSRRHACRKAPRLTGREMLVVTEPYRGWIVRIDGAYIKTYDKLYQWPQTEENTSGVYSTWIAFVTDLGKNEGGGPGLSYAVLVDRDISNVRSGMKVDVLGVYCKRWCGELEGGGWRNMPLIIAKEFRLSEFQSADDTYMRYFLLAGGALLFVLITVMVTRDRIGALAMRKHTAERRKTRRERLLEKRRSSPPDAAGPERETPGDGPGSEPGPGAPPEGGASS